LILANEVARKQVERAGLESAVAAYLASGGTIDQTPALTIMQRPVREAQVKTPAQQQLRSDKARAKALKACSLSFREIAARMNTTVKEVRKLLG
jgi:hypothetical protein